MNLHAEIIDLASEGWFYPSGSIYSSGQIRILPITAEHEEILTSQNLLRRGLAEKQFLNSVVEGGLDFSKLLHCDKQSILLNLRIANYGAGTKIRTKCADCEAETEQEISFAFRSNPFDFSKWSRGVNKLTYTFPKCQKVVTFRLPTCDEHEVYEKRGWLTFAKTITEEISEVEDINEFYDYRLPATDSTMFRKFFETSTPGYVNETVISCPGCQTSRKTKIEINHEIFGIRPESKATIHSEIFDLCYYGNGAFTQDGVYHMPTSLRNFYIKKLIDAKKSEVEAQKKAGEGVSPNRGIARPPTVKK